MKSVPSFLSSAHQSLSKLAAAEDPKPVMPPASASPATALVTRFGDAVDVRNRGTLRMSRFAGSQRQATEPAPAVVRLWMDEQCHELSAHEARALAAQLAAAAAFADKQNGH
ncbi:MAG TPA: hypothetical protein VEC06_04830 [Paucimonas sp.]|nr:hypothetical protein [Paucimonas sp.]